MITYQNLAGDVFIPAALSHSRRIHHRHAMRLEDARSVQPARVGDRAFEDHIHIYGKLGDVKVAIAVVDAHHFYIRAMLQFFEQQFLFYTGTRV